MTEAGPVVLSAAVEGALDEAVLERLMAEAGGQLGAVHGRSGKAVLRQRIGGYNNAARFAPWVVLIDLDQDADCAPPLVHDWLPEPAPRMCLRIAVRETEAWLLADRERLAKFLSVARSRIPRKPEREADPKQVMVELARRSRRRAVREDMVPRPASGRTVGPAYNARLIRFVTAVETGWRPAVAAANADSLRRCLDGLQRLINPPPSDQPTLPFP